jgi:hypothetical protein
VLKKSNVALLAPVYKKRDKEGEKYSNICLLNPRQKKALCKDFLDKRVHRPGEDSF